MAKKDKTDKSLGISPTDIVDEANSKPTTVDDIGNTINESAQAANEVDTLPPVHEFSPTGCTTLDLAIANQLPGGIPLGRIVHVFGAGSTCKSVLGTTVLGYAQRTGRFAHMADCEHTLDPNFARIYGLNCDDDKTFKLTTKLDSDPEKENSIEALFDTYLANIIFPKGRDKKMDMTPKIIVIDTISVLPSLVELAEEMDKASFAVTRAKQMSRGFRKYQFPISNSNTTLFCIDQTRDNVGAGPFGGAKEVTSGGRALEFHSSVQLHLHHDQNITNSKGVTTGIWVRGKVVKNKVAPPFRDFRFKITWEYGLDDISSNLYFLAEDQVGKDKAKNRTEKLKLFGEEHQIMNWVKMIEDENAEEALRQEVYKIWKKKYDSEEGNRKSRIW
jgi:recombination protein RecA